MQTVWAERTAGATSALGKVKGIYTGFSATLLRDIPFSMLYFPAYAIIREQMAKLLLKPGEDPTFCECYNYFSKFESNKSE